MVYDLGLQLKISRKNKNLTQNQVANLIGTTKSSISGYENNTSSPSIEILKKLALLYGVSCDYLLGIDSRYTIVLDGLNVGQCRMISDIVDRISRELKFLNKNVNYIKKNNK